MNSSASDVNRLIKRTVLRSLQLSSCVWSSAMPTAITVLGMSFSLVVKPVQASSAVPVNSSSTATLEVETTHTNLSDLDQINGSVEPQPSSEAQNPEEQISVLESPSLERIEAPPTPLEPNRINAGVREVSGLLHLTPVTFPLSYVTNNTGIQSVGMMQRVSQPFDANSQPNISRTTSNVAFSGQAQTVEYHFAPHSQTFYHSAVLGQNTALTEPISVRTGAIAPITNDPVSEESPEILPDSSTDSSLVATDLLPSSFLNPNLLVAQTSTEPPADTPDAVSQDSRVLGTPYIRLQGAYLLQGDESSARARVTAFYAVNPSLAFGAEVDLTGGSGFSDSRSEGLNLNELYVAASLPNLPNVRVVAGLMDLTSYFDRNSFAKDATLHFFNSVFQTNPALSATGISSRLGLLVNWGVTDNLEIKAATFSSSRGLDHFALDAFAGEVALRFGTAIIRGTYVSDRDAGSGDGFQEIFQFNRGNDEFGVLPGDRETAYGLNAEFFIPSLNLGLFGRYGRYENHDLGRGGDTFSFGMTLLDLFFPSDRLGLAYGRQLSNDDLRREQDDKVPDVVELFYDVRLARYLRAGVMIQQRNEFSETIAGFRIRTEFDVREIGRLF